MSLGPCELPTFRCLAGSRVHACLHRTSQLRQTFGPKQNFKFAKLHAIYEEQGSCRPKSRGGVKWRWGKIACQETGRHPLRMSQTQLQDGWRSLSPRRNVPLLQDACVRRKIQSVQSKSHLGQLSMRDGRATCYADLFCCRLFGCFGTGRTINE